jgi:hypothetical protein
MANKWPNRNISDELFCEDILNDSCFGEMERLSNQTIIKIEIKSKSRSIIRESVIM